jgi:23S rRNA (uridine2552-2'-O)-methyltransferase
LSYKVKDHYFKQAKKDDFKARSVYKLIEINEKYSIVKSGDKVFDLGSFPGSWAQYLAQVVTDKGLVVGIDIQDLSDNLGSNFKFLHRSIFDLKDDDFKGLPLKFNLVSSDMAPSTTGIKDVDQSASIELCRAAFEVCKTRLKKNGHFVCKIFHSNQVKAFTKELKGSFKEVHLFKPKGTRAISSEIFIVCKKYFSK